MMIQQQPQLQPVQQHQQTFQLNVNGHVAVPKYQSNKVSGDNMSQPLLSQPQQIEMGAYHAMNNLNNL